jgi:hypothetical protein
VRLIQAPDNAFICGEAGVVNVLKDVMREQFVNDRIFPRPRAAKVADDIRGLTPVYVYVSLPVIVRATQV